MKKKTIHFSDQDLKELKELMNLLDLTKIYGGESKAIKFSITFTMERLKAYDKVIPELNPIEWGMWLSSVKKVMNQRKKGIHQYNQTKSEVK